MLRVFLATAVLLCAEERRAVLNRATIAADYLVHSVMHESQNVFVRDYLVVEVTFTPARRESIMLAHSSFFLRINGKKTAIIPQTPSMVAASLKYDDWERRPHMEASGGVGDTGVILGRPRQSERFPGDPTSRQRLPKPPRAPDGEDRPGVERAEIMRADEVVVRAALEEGETSKPIHGYLYFAYKGKTESIKKLELVYNGPAGDAIIPML